MIRIAIVQFPGSNCERETILAVKRANMQPVEFLWNEPKEKLSDMDGFIIVGGFSYEDRSRAGIIAALDPVMKTIFAESEKGKPVLGICNGAQILVETGLVPGLENHKIGLSLSENKRMVDGKVLGTGFYNAWVPLRLCADYQRNAFTRTLNSKSILRMPVAHGEGRFIMPEALLQEIKAQGLPVFQYCDEQGHINPNFPVNPNGSLANIAAISNKAGNVMAIMPHPERTTNGDPIFQSMRESITASNVMSTVPLYYYPRREEKKLFRKKENSAQWFVELMITDNQALTVQNCLRQIGIPVTVARQVHWEIECVSSTVLTQIKKSGVLYNERKECEVTKAVGLSEEKSADLTDSPSQSENKTVSILVRAKEDLIGTQKKQLLQDHYSIQGINTIHHGILWHFSSETANINALIDSILKTHIIYNPYAHDYYHYS
jgi:phosphoribosylformylglycinamidine synthase I